MLCETTANPAEPLIVVCATLLLDEHCLHLRDVRRAIPSLDRAAGGVSDLQGFPPVRGPRRSAMDDAR